MKGLPIPVRRVLRHSADDVTLERVWRRVAATRSGQAYRAVRYQSTRRVLIPIGVAAIVAAAAVGWVFLRHEPVRDPGPLRYANGQEIGSLAVAAEASATVGAALSDGSSLLIGPGTQLDLLENTGTNFSLLLLRGRTVFDVRPGGPRRWTIEAGLASVEVVGTRFTVERSTTRVHVDVERGVVLVRSDLLPEHVRRLSGAQFVDVELPTAPVPAPVAPTKLSPSTSYRSTRPTRRAPTSTPPAAEELPAPQPSPIPWKAMAHDGDYARAYQTLGSTGVAAEVQRGPSIEDLFALADIARYSGHPSSAVSPLEQILQYHRSESGAAMAAFTLGKIELDSLGNPGRAADAFAQAIELGPPQGLLESTYERLVEAKSRAGDTAGARAVSAEYLRRFPDGQYRNEMSAGTAR
jgi:transmembrane sensor